MFSQQLNVGQGHTWLTIYVYPCPHIVTPNYYVPTPCGYYETDLNTASCHIDQTQTQTDTDVCGHAKALKG